MRKLAALLALLLAFCLPLGVGVAAAEPRHSDLVYAEPEDEDRKDHDESDEMHRELDGRFQDVSRVIIPPRGLIPAESDDPNFLILPEEPVIRYAELPQISLDSQEILPLGSGEPPTYLILGPGQEVPTATTQNANKYPPIQLRDLVRSGDGPAADFMRSAVILLVILAVIAAVLLGVASKSALRLKKKARAL